MDRITELQIVMQSLPRPDLIGERPSSEELQRWIAFAEECMATLAQPTTPAA